MVVPVLRTHLDRYKQREQRCHRARRYGRQLRILTQAFRQGRHAETYPDTEGIERAGIRVVALTGLIGGLVQVEHDGDSRHEEQEEGDPESLHTLMPSVTLIEQAQDA